MKKTKFIFIIILPLMWIAYCLFEFFTSRLSSQEIIPIILLPTLVLFFINYLFIKISLRFYNGLSKKVLTLLLVFLLFLDQGVKLIIKLFFFKKEFYIINNLLSFNPIINTKGSWLNVRFNININFLTLIILNIIALFIFIEMYRYFNTKHEKNFYADLYYVFITVGSLCSLIDKIFYGGSLDFIGISNLFIADFKDMYINIAIFMLIILSYISDNSKCKNNKNNTISNDIKEPKNFFKFIYYDIKFNIFKIK